VEQQQVLRATARTPQAQRCSQQKRSAQLRPVRLLSARQRRSQTKRKPKAEPALAFDP
jgi:hypothetical protein